ncbi:jg18747, partial [Pararge aegeria aegeria]
MSCWETGRYHWAAIERRGRGGRLSCLRYSSSDPTSIM